MLDPYCRTHDVENLFVVDASFFPSSAAVNPALTIAAQALRVADHIKERIYAVGRRSAMDIRPDVDTWNRQSVDESTIVSRKIAA